MSFELNCCNIEIKNTNQFLYQMWISLIFIYTYKFLPVHRNVIYLIKNYSMYLTGNSKDKKNSAFRNKLPHTYLPLFLDPPPWKIPLWWFHNSPWLSMKLFVSVWSKKNPVIKRNHRFLHCCILQKIINPLKGSKLYIVSRFLC